MNYSFLEENEPVMVTTTLKSMDNKEIYEEHKKICKNENGSSVAKSNTLLSVLLSTLRSSSKVSYSFWLAVFQNERVSMLFLIVGLSFIYRCVVMATLVK